MVKVLRSIVSGPLEPHIVGFVEGLLRQGYTRTSAEQHVCFIAQLDRWMVGEDLGLDGLSRLVIDRYLTERVRLGMSSIGRGRRCDRCWITSPRWGCCQFQTMVRARRSKCF